ARARRCAAPRTGPHTYADRQRGRRGRGTRSARSWRRGGPPARRGPRRRRRPARRVRGAAWPRGLAADLVGAVARRAAVVAAPVPAQAVALARREPVADPAPH